MLLLFCYTAQASNTVEWMVETDGGMLTHYQHQFTQLPDSPQLSEIDDENVVFAIRDVLSDYRAFQNSETELRKYYQHQILEPWENRTSGQFLNLHGSAAWFPCNSVSNHTCPDLSVRLFGNLAGVYEQPKFDLLAGDLNLETDIQAFLIRGRFGLGDSSFSRSITLGVFDGNTEASLTYDVIKMEQENHPMLEVFLGNDDRQVSSRLISVPTYLRLGMMPSSSNFEEELKYGLAINVHRNPDKTGVSVGGYGREQLSYLNSSEAKYLGTISLNAEVGATIKVGN